ncbi:uncharacterized protein G2W53_022617 [Senna tora]|uniref:Uncharacterized protein n=1 Tax=Senna tora TaxID=362788 RepID=A0A834TLG9_9FABA|nr:uncharacterized protein G2W53_022617 [Senna tora]
MTQTGEEIERQIEKMEKTEMKVLVLGDPRFPGSGITNARAVQAEAVANGGFQV